MSYSFLCCILFWLIVIGVPIALSYWFGRSRVRNDFKLHVRSLHGLVLRESNESIEVQLPSEAGTIAAAFFPLSDHWYGKRVLELHFNLPATNAQCFVCSNSALSRSTLDGWTVYQDQDMARFPLVHAATATPETADKYFRGGLIQAYSQFGKIHPRSGRIAIDNDRLILLVGEFTSSPTELSSLLVFGIQLVRQLDAIHCGEILVLGPSSTTGAESQCPICFSPAVQPVACQRCGTPHCKECWTYNDQVCGVFGCGGNPVNR
ncbi:MAG: hypothetical protein JNL67_05065 [Planctomycetaceae bacterium]|nr:hypothetical protein [Planctomycetaceae bacterium]